MALRNKLSAALSREASFEESLCPPAIQSSLLPPILGDNDLIEKASIFDVSSAINETLLFFSQHRCRLYFADLYQCEVITSPERFIYEEADEETAQVQRAQALVDSFCLALNIPEGSQFDLCLLWDFPNYLDDMALWAFGKVLAKYTHRDTRIHCFGVHNTRVGKIPFENHRFAIADTSTIAVKTVSAEKPRYPHTQKYIQQALGESFAVKRSLLLSDGKLELLLKSR